MSTDLASEPRLGIVGASARSAVMSARRAGLASVAADLFGDWDLRRLAPATRLAALAAGLESWSGWHDVRCWMYTGGLENRPQLVDRLARRCPLLGNSGESLRGCRDPLRLQDVLSRAGVPFPRTLPAGHGVPGRGPWLAKTYRGAGGNGTWWHAWRPAPQSAARRYYLQQYVPGTSLAALYVAAPAAVTLLGVTRQWVGAPLARAAPFQYCGSLTGWPLASGVQADIHRAGQVVAAAFQLRGLFGIDLVLSAGQVWVIEVNPRYTASAEVVELASGIATLGLHLVACGVAAAANPCPAAEGAAGKLVLYASRPLQVTAAMTAWAQARSPWQDGMAVADVPEPPARITAGAPVWTLLARGASYGDVEVRLGQLAREAEEVIYREGGAACA